MKLEFDQFEAGPALQAPARVPEDHVAEPAPPLQFDLPRSVLAQLVATSAGYLLVMGLAFRAGTGIGLIFAIFGVVLLGYYGLPIVMARSSGAAKSDERNGAWGIDTASGYLPGRAAWAQIMTVPLLMLAWAVVVAVLK